MLTFLINSGLLFHSLHERDLWVPQSLIQACLQTSLRCLTQRHYCFRSQEHLSIQLHYCDNTFRFNLFCPIEPVSPGTSLVTYDKIPPTEPSSITRSRDMPQCNRYRVHTEKSQFQVWVFLKISLAYIAIACRYVIDKQLNTFLHIQEYFSGMNTFRQSHECFSGMNTFLQSHECISGRNTFLSDF